MSKPNEGSIRQLVVVALGEARADTALRSLEIDDALLAEGGPSVSRAAFAMALNVVLFADLIDRVPSGARYARDRTIRFDHGALRTIRFANGPTGALPAGHESFARILEPLGYRVSGLYPLPALGMTGRAYTHQDAADAIPQFFVGELHVERFSAAFGHAAQRVFGASRDPLDDAGRSVLAAFAADGCVPIERASRALPGIAAAFGCHHAPARLADYNALLAESAEAAWIATEGQAFNHATDRVADVDALADRLRADGWPIKDRVEVSASGRVRQTALRADSVERVLVDEAGATVRCNVPGSFFEFISRDRDAAAVLDLRFDSGNATGIFAMTRAA